MFDASILTRAKTVFDSEAARPDRINAGLDLTGGALQLAQGQQANAAQDDEERRRRQQEQTREASGFSPPPLPEGIREMQQRPAVQNLKKVADAVASFYTGGAWGLAKNVGGQMLSKNNPNAGALVSLAGKALG